MDADILERTRQITEEIRLCNHCLGRLFLEVDGKNNEKRGQKIREALKQKEPNECELCGGFFKQVDNIAWKAARELGKYDARTIIVASRVPKAVLEKEEEIWKKYGVKQSESIKKDINRSVGKKMADIGPWRYDPEAPEARIIVDLTGNVQVEITPIYITATLRSDTPSKSETRSIIKTAVEAIFGARDVRIRSKEWKGGTKIVIEVIDPSHRHVNVKILERALEETTGRKIIEIIGTTSAEGARKFLGGEKWIR